MIKQIKNTLRLFLCKLFLLVTLLGISNSFFVNSLDLYEVELVECEGESNDTSLDAEDSLEELDKMLFGNYFFVELLAFTNRLYVNSTDDFYTEYLSIKSPPPEC